jgi:hypothetical protein
MKVCSGSLWRNDIIVFCFMSDEESQLSMAMISIPIGWIYRAYKSAMLNDRSIKAFS